MRELFSLLFLLISLLGFSQSAKTLKDIRVNQDRIEKRIFELAQFGRGTDGKSYRVGFSKADQEGRAYYIGLMRNAGLEVSVDYAGNIIGKRNGKDPSKKPIAFGSHIDMVPDGGNYDGCVGSMGALEVIEALNENKIITTHPLELIIFSNEEGGTIGSNAMVGNLNAEALKTISQSGVTMADGIRAIGGKPESIGNSIRKKGDLLAFVELHIEQGGILEKEAIQIGVVEGIVGIEHWNITVEGFANHAGTTPMNMRQDALLAAAKLIVAVNETITAVDGRQVGTIGKISALPGAFNVVPGKVIMGLEIRDLSYEKLWQLFRDIEKKAANIASTSETKISFVYEPPGSKPALTDKMIQDIIVANAKAMGLTYKFMQSGAGHDAQEISVIAPVAMIFVPSVGGISHSPKEFTKAIDMANGANVLLHTILALDN